MYEQVYKRKDVWMCDFSGAVGNEQTGIRPAIICSNDLGNRFSPNVIVIPVSSSMIKAKLPTHVYIKAREDGLELDSVVIAEQIRNIDKWNLIRKLTELTDEEMEKVDYAIDVALDRVRDRK